MQDLPSPRNGNGSFEAYAKPIMMFQPEETRVKQRQRLLSDELTKQPQPVNRPPTPPGKLQIGKISSMLLRDFAGGGKTAAVAELSPGQTSPEPRANGLSGHQQWQCTESFVEATERQQQRRDRCLSTASDTSSWQAQRTPGGGGMCAWTSLCQLMVTSLTRYLYGVSR